MPAAVRNGWYMRTHRFPNRQPQRDITGRSDLCRDDAGQLAGLAMIRGTDLRALIRSGASDEDLRDAVAGVWTKRADRYSEIRTEGTTDLPRIEMSYIGG